MFSSIYFYFFILSFNFIFSFSLSFQSYVFLLLMYSPLSLFFLFMFLLRCLGQLLGRCMGSSTFFFDAFNLSILAVDLVCFVDGISQWDAFIVS